MSEQKSVAGSIRLILVSAMILTGVASECHSQQTFFLDFDSFTSVSSDPKDHVYTVSERSSITSTLNSKFAGFDISFVDTTPSGSSFSTVYFNKGLSEAEHIDFRNLDSSDTADVHIPKVMESAGLTGPFSSPDVVTASVNIAAHEAAHLLGVRHHDSFLLPGSGVPSASFVPDFLPFYPGPTAAGFTSMEFMALTTSVSFSSSSLLDPDLFFGPRSAVKLMMASPPMDFTFSETSDMHNSFETPQVLELKTFDIVNNIPLGVPGSGVDLQVDMAVVKDAYLGPSSAGPESDYYAFAGFGGDLFQLEVISSILDHRLGDLLDPRISVFSASDPYTELYYGYVFNDDERESTDSIMLDLILPYDDVYIVEVWSSPKASASMAMGEYELYLYRFRGSVPEPGTCGVCLVSVLLLMGRPRRRKSLPCIVG